MIKVKDVAYVRFPAASWAAEGNYGTAFPASYTLSVTEASDVADAVDGFNAAIAGAVAMVNGSGMAHCGLVDANALMGGLDAGQKTHFLILVGGGMTVDMAEALTLFSLDGIHPNNIGYGVITNAFLEEITALTGETLDPVDLGTLAWDSTYGHPGTPDKKMDGSAAVDQRIDGAMANLFR